jgi:predicted AlkP superfamily pyrophosphatase or phosphodiesterase
MTRRAAAAALCGFILAGVAGAQSRPAQARKPAPPKAGAAKPAPAEAPKLVLIVVVDQFRYDYLTRYGAQYTAGIARLLKQGAVFAGAHLDHYPTVTAVGHSAALSGAMPSVSGIVGNAWYDRETGKEVTSVSDPTVKLLGGDPDRAGASPHRLLVSTLGDEMKMSGRWQGMKAVGLSLKDRGAVLTAGHMADGAYWFDSGTGNFVSSTYYFGDLPAWVKEFNARRAPQQYSGKAWTSMVTGRPFMLMQGSGRVLHEAIYGSAFGNDLLGEFAEAAIAGENLGRSGGVDLLSVSFSSNDAVGHRLGPDSPEVHDITLKTDLAIGRLFDALDKQIGMANVLAVFTSDHGVAPLPEVQQKRHMPGGRINAGSVPGAANAALTARYGAGRYAAGGSAGSMVFDHHYIAQRKLNLEEVQATAAAAVRLLPHIARVYTREELRRGPAPADMVLRRVLNGFYYQRAADLTAVPEPYWLFEAGGTSHGSPWNYDSHVPLILMGPGIRAGTYYRPARVNDIAPTLAALLGVAPPSGSSGRILEEALAPR